MNHSHLIIILNRAAADNGWIHIVPKGELPNREAGVVQVLDDAALDSILANIAADKKRLGDQWPGVYAGREHFIYNDEKDSAALAWFKDFEKRPNGIWAKEDGLTPAGQEAIRNKEYKFTSFVADRRDTQKLDNNRVRILKIDTVGFTNQANGKELLTPITNRGDNLDDAQRRAAASSQQQKPNMKNIAVELGLDANTDEAGILTVVRQFKNRGDITAADLTTLQNRKKELETENKTLLEEQVDALMDAHSIKADDKVRNRLKPTLAGYKNREERVAALLDFGFKPVEAAKGNTTEQQRQLRNRDTKQPDKANASGLTEQELAQKADAEVQDYRIKNRCSYTEARNAVRIAKPELFGLTK